MPALTTGLPVTDARAVGPSALKLVLPGTNDQVTWNGLPSVFSRARAAGINTALIGWYHPYSRVFSEALNYSQWHPYPPFEQTRGESFGEVALNQIWSLLTPLQLRRLQIRIFEDALARSLHLSTNLNYGLSLLHLPVPHRPGIYDPQRQSLTMTTLSLRKGYLDNLLLTDQTLGKLRQAMEQAGRWEAAWIIVSSDHWWRDSTVYDGEVDHRVPFIVKAPAQRSPLLIETSLNTLITHDLILAILRKELHRSEEVVAWLKEHRIAPPASYGHTAHP
jgi:hypothetical protein